MDGKAYPDSDASFESDNLKIRVDDFPLQLEVPAHTKADLFALRVVQIGAIAAVLIVLPNPSFDLDRFLIPKELVLHITAVITSLLQAYGVRIDFFATNRVPGGTLGNRNFIAHVAAFGLPICFLAALR